MEAYVSRKLKEAFVSEGAVCWKISDRFRASRPDLLFAYHGETGFIETKVWPNTPTALQQLTLLELSAVGINAYEASYDKALKTITITHFVTRERMTFLKIKEAALWLLEQHT